jgi:hypothetical protein
MGKRIGDVKGMIALLNQTTSPIFLLFKIGLLPCPYWKWRRYFWSNIFLFAAEKQLPTPYYSTLIK